MFWSILFAFVFFVVGHCFDGKLCSCLKTLVGAYLKQIKVRASPGGKSIKSNLFLSLLKTRFQNGAVAGVSGAS